ncbi:MAG: alpha/beta fold hydrolase [Deltaproteobacteria bacterium]|nr:alpha/beta fold hydrolase [Deltaproteobacteria bacterium]
MSILLLHGFTGHPDDLLPLEQALLQRGFTCERPCLPGHCTSVTDLNRTKAEDWINFVRKRNPDVVIGLSMGGLLGVILAAERPISKLILLAPAFKLKPFGQTGTMLSKLGLHNFVRMYPKMVGRDIQDPIARSQSKAYDRVPLRGLLEFDKVRQQALKALPRVKCPTHTFLGAHDHTIDNSAAMRLMKNPVMLPHSGHVLSVDRDKKELIAQCLKILEK